MSAADRSALLAEIITAINAEGGIPPRGDEYARGFNDAIGRALDILEAIAAREDAAASHDMMEAA